MRIDNIDFLKFFPDLMQNDKDVIAIADHNMYLCNQKAHNERV